MSIRNGQFCDTPLGKNSMRSIPKFIATFLGLSDTDSFTGQCFRRSSATTLADSNVSRLNLKRHGGWKSDSVAEGYLLNSKKLRTDIASTLSGNHTPDVTPLPKCRLDDSSSRAFRCVFNFNNCSTVNLTVPSDFVPKMKQI